MFFFFPFLMVLCTTLFFFYKSRVIQKLVILNTQEFRDNEEMEKVLSNLDLELGNKNFIREEIPIRKEKLVFKPYRKIVRSFRIVRNIYLTLLILLGLGAMYFIAKTPEKIPEGYEDFMDI